MRVWARFVQKSFFDTHSCVPFPIVGDRGHFWIFRYFPYVWGSGTWFEVNIRAYTCSTTFRDVNLFLAPVVKVRGPSLTSVQSCSLSLLLVLFHDFGVVLLGCLGPVVKVRSLIWHYNFTFWVHMCHQLRGFGRNRSINTSSRPLLLVPYLPW